MPAKVDIPDPRISLMMGMTFAAKRSAASAATLRPIAELLVTTGFKLSAALQHRPDGSDPIIRIDPRDDQRELVMALGTGAVVREIHSEDSAYQRACRDGA